jgi:hypothetical protein
MAIFPTLLSPGHRRLTIAIIGAVVLTVNTLIFRNIFIGSIGFILYFIPTAIATGIVIEQKLQTKNNRFSSLMIGSLGLILINIIIGSIVYYAYQMDILTVYLILLLTLTLHIPSVRVHITQKTLSIERPNRVLLFIIVECTLLFILYRVRTSGLLVSPWQLVGPIFFLLYAGGVTVYLSILRVEKDIRTHIVLSSILFFVSYGVAVIVYRLGFGFDAFIHRATETWIVNHGSILPKEPYYIGQYSLITYLRNLTHIPIFYLDSYLVPVLSAIFIPHTVHRTLRRYIGAPPSTSTALSLLILLVPFLSLHLSTPHNLVLLLSILGFFTTMRGFSYDRFDILSLLIGLSAILTHPLLGAPLFIFISAVSISKYLKQKSPIIKMIPPIILFITTTLLLPTLFLINNLRSGHGLPILSNPLSRLPDFFSLLARPYYYARHAPLRFELVYGWQTLITPIIIILAIYGLYILNKKSSQLSNLYLSMSVGLVSSAWLLRSWVTFLDVVSYEQGDYPLRLLRGAVIVLLPVACIGLYSLSELVRKRIDQQHYILFINYGAIGIISILLTLSFYLSYPQKNQKVQFPGYNVTRADFEAVEYINNKNEEINYIVLANQLTSAAALTRFSFVKYYETELGPLYFYSIPTGGPLYAEYLHMLYEGQKREYMERAMDIAGVDTAYFVISSFWKNSNEIMDGAKKTADEYIPLSNGDVWVFTYRR